MLILTVKIDILCIYDDSKLTWTVKLCASQNYEIYTTYIYQTMILFLRGRNGLPYECVL